MLYDTTTKKTQEHKFNDVELQSISRYHKLNNGFIVAINTKSKRITRYAYISEKDYYDGKANLTYLY